MPRHPAAGAHAGAPPFLREDPRPPFVPELPARRREIHSGRGKTCAEPPAAPNAEAPPASLRPDPTLGLAPPAREETPTARAPGRLEGGGGWPGRAPRPGLRERPGGQGRPGSQAGFGGVQAGAEGPSVGTRSWGAARAWRPSRGGRLRSGPGGLGLGRGRGPQAAPGRRSPQPCPSGRSGPWRRREARLGSARSLAGPRPSAPAPAAASTGSARRPASLRVGCGSSGCHVGQALKGPRTARIRPGAS